MEYNTSFLPEKDNSFNETEWTESSSSHFDERPTQIEFPVEDSQPSNTWHGYSTIAMFILPAILIIQLIATFHDDKADGNEPSWHSFMIVGIMVVLFAAGTRIYLAHFPRSSTATILPIVLLVVTDALISFEKLSGAAFFLAASAAALGVVVALNNNQSDDTQAFLREGLLAVTGQNGQEVLEETIVQSFGP